MAVSTSFEVAVVRPSLVVVAVGPSAVVSVSAISVGVLSADDI